MTERCLNRFMSKIEFAADGCWLWSGALDKDGYSKGLFDSQFEQGHRMAHKWWNGPILAELEIDHLCRVRRCVNPAHLEAVTHQENMRRAKGRIDPNHCSQGHELTADNLYEYKYGNRQLRICKRCSNEWSRRSYLERRALAR